MAGEQLLKTVTAATVTAIIAVLSNSAHASDEFPDVEFLEWLGQATEAEDLGMDIDEALEAQEQPPASESNEDNTK